MAEPAECGGPAPEPQPPLPEEVSRAIRLGAYAKASLAATQLDVESGAFTLTVTWLASGEVACELEVTHATHLGDVKALIFEKAGVPVEEQRLFVPGAAAGAGGSEELPGGEAGAAQALAALLGQGTEAVLQLLRTASDPRNTDLAHFSAMVSLEPLVNGELERIRTLAKSMYGTVDLHRWRRPGLSQDGADCCVAVKKMPNHLVNQNVGREMSEYEAFLGRCERGSPCMEDALTEIGILSYLARQRDLPLYLLRMLGALVDPRDTYLITEYAEGGELFTLAASSARLPEVQLRTYGWQLLQAVRYLHAHHIGHRDISLENVLLKNGAVRLMDFGMAALSRRPGSAQLLRYFRAVGKPTYRAPECTVPQEVEVPIVPAREAVPGDVVQTAYGSYLCEVRLPADAEPGKLCRAELWGYTLPPADVFAVGVCLFNLAWNVRPWAFAGCTDPYFAYVYQRGDQGIEALVRAWRCQLVSPEAMTLLAHMLRPDPAKRPQVADCLSSEWFAPLAAVPVPVHPVPDRGTGVLSDRFRSRSCE